jgi:hypothetical protein
MAWSFPGIAYPVECLMTQSRGVHADPIQLTFLPQGANFPTAGTLTLTWGVTSITLPNCILDTSTLHYANDGIHHVVLGWDRRKRWELSPPIDGWYNVDRAGIRIPSREKNLRQLCRILLDQLGETSGVVTAVPTTVYPEVRWNTEPTHLALEALMKKYGLDLVLGFGSEPVTIVTMGSGSSLPSGNEFVTSLTADPKLRPRWIRNAFGTSIQQSRFKLEAYGLSADGEWLPINDLPYAPSGTLWTKEDPYTLPSVLASGINDWKLAIRSVFRAYKIVKFSDDTLDIPGSGGAIARIEDVFPLLGHLIDTEDIREDNSYKPFKLFGRFFREIKERGQPAEFENTAKDYELTYVRSWLDMENGMLFFEDPIFLIEADEFVPADLYIEVAHHVKHQTNFSPSNYVYDVSFDTGGYGYFTIYTPEIQFKSVVAYDSDHLPTGVTTNQSTLNGIAASQAALLTSSMSDSMTQVKTYSIPKLAIRCDGAISQIQHVMTNGEKNHAVNRTSASRYREFDRKIPSQAKKMAHYQGLQLAQDERWKEVLRKREDPTDA